MKSFSKRISYPPDHFYKGLQMTLKNISVPFVSGLGCSIQQSGFGFVGYACTAMRVRASLPGVTPVLGWDRGPSADPARPAEGLIRWKCESDSVRCCGPRPTSSPGSRSTDSGGGTGKKKIRILPRKMYRRLDTEKIRTFLHNFPSLSVRKYIQKPQKKNTSTSYIFLSTGGPGKL